jgi:hypothetical protein
MFVPFESLNDQARIWIYQADKQLSAADKETISKTLSQFSTEWSAHGQPLRSSFLVEFDRFIILAADEQYNLPSGCSIDDSVHTIKALGQQLKIDFFDRKKIAFKDTSKDIFLLQVNELKQKHQDGIWNKDSLTFNNLITTKGKLTSQWILPAMETWLKRYLTEKEIAA